jgi:hypothetical protein
MKNNLFKQFSHCVRACTSARAWIQRLYPSDLYRNCCDVGNQSLNILLLLVYNMIFYLLHFYLPLPTPEFEAEYGTCLYTYSLFNDTVSNPDNIRLDGSEQWTGMWIGVVMAYFKAISWHMLGGTNEILRIVTVLPDFQTGHHPNTSQKHYHLSLFTHSDQC